MPTPPPPPTFYFQGQALETVDSFKYLGIQFHCNKGLAGSADLRLAAAQKAAFALHNKCVTTGIHNPALLCRLFRTVVIPVLFYAAQVTLPFWTKEQTQEADRIFKRYMKSALGVPGTTPDYFVYGEIAQFPITMYPLTWAMKYWNRIWSEGHQSHLTRTVAEEDWQYRYRTGRQSFWVAKTLTLFIKSNVRLGSLELTVHRQIPDIKEQILGFREQFHRNWEHRTDGGSPYNKFYLEIKPSWGTDRSLQIPDKKLRILLTRFRAGCLRLNCGPRHGHQRPSTDQTRPCCESPKETVHHFLFECPAYAKPRARFRINRFTSPQDLFCTPRSHPEPLARFISLAWGIRTHHAHPT